MYACMCKGKADRNEVLLSNPSPQSSGNPSEEEAEKMNESNGMEATRRTMSSKSAGHGSYGLVGAEAAGTVQLQSFVHTLQL